MRAAVQGRPPALAHAYTASPRLDISEQANVPVHVIPPICRCRRDLVEAKIIKAAAIKYVREAISVNGRDPGE